MMDRGSFALSEVDSRPLPAFSVVGSESRDAEQLYWKLLGTRDCLFGCP